MKDYISTGGFKLGIYGIKCIICIISQSLHYSLRMYCK